jgi:hypothetical protein
MRSRSPKPFGDQQQRSVALALQQRVGGDGRAHLHCLDGARRDRCATLQAQQIADALHGRVAILLRVLRQQLVRDDFTGSGLRPTISVNVPPRSTQNCHMVSSSIVS